jgi:ribonuclease T1
MTAFSKKIVFLFTLLFMLGPVAAKENSQLSTIKLADLPVEAQATLVAIKAGGPFLYSKDGAVFGNYEARLPKQRRGYYHEYTVKTPRARNRGARRIIAGCQTKISGEYYYTADHYQNFNKIKE